MHQKSSTKGSKKIKFSGFVQKRKEAGRIQCNNIIIINAYRHSCALHAWVDMQAKEEATRQTHKTHVLCPSYIRTISWIFKNIQKFFFPSSCCCCSCLLFTSANVSLHLLTYLLTYILALTSCSCLLHRRRRLLSTTAKPSVFFLFNVFALQSSFKKKNEKIRKEK